MARDPLERFLEVTDRYADHPAVVEGETEICYGELARLANRYAFRINQACSGNDTDNRRVLICLPRGAAAYAAMFGTLMAGCYYSPVNIDQPLLRQQAIVRTFSPNVIIGAASVLDSLELDEAVVAIDPDALSGEELAVPCDPHGLAYVMFTSGTTGQPKGVKIGRDGLGHYTDWAITAMEVQPSDRWSQHPNIGFDLSVLDIYGALCAGATLVPLNDRRERLLPAEAIKKYQLSIWNSVPSVIDLMRRGGRMTPERLSSLRMATFCGEPLLREHLEVLFECRPDIAVHNTYGPTEATVSMTLLRLDAANYQSAIDASVALGEPIPGMMLLLDDGESGMDVDTMAGSMEGEIVIAGPQVSHGYWKSEELTRAAFGQLQSGGEALPYYRTGDWAVRKNGHVFFSARIDRQIKIKGHRIELSEIESVLRDAGAVAAFVTLTKDRIIAFVELPVTVSAADMKAACTNRLPHYAVPSHIEVCSQLPRNSNDKIDAKQLSAKAEAISGTQR